MREEYPRAWRITRASDLERLYVTGRQVRTKDLDVRYTASPLLLMRVGIVVSRHRQSVVKRNRLKRRLRALARTVLIPTNVRAEVVIIARPSAYTASFRQLRAEVEEISRAVSSLVSDKGPV